jgi:hypothetical protein
MLVAAAMLCASNAVQSQEPDWQPPLVVRTEQDDAFSPLDNGDPQAEPVAAPEPQVAAGMNLQHAIDGEIPPTQRQFPSQYSQSPSQGPYLAPRRAPQPRYGYYWTPTWQFLPDGLLYKSYIAGPKEPRFASAWLHQQGHGWIWDVTLGGRVGVLRYGTQGAVRPQGWQLDLEGAAFPRLDVENAENLMSSDFRFGVPLTWAAGPWQTKFGYYHISSHVGDEYLLTHPNFQRVNYVRDSILLGVGYFATDSVRLYGETAYAFHYSVAEPWEFQFGAEYSPLIVKGRRGMPFAAVNVQLFEEQDFGGSLNVMAGWQWRSEISDRVLRVGLQYFNGKSSQFAFYNESEQLVGVGVWLDQ